MRHISEEENDELQTWYTKMNANTMGTIGTMTRITGWCGDVKGQR